MRHGIQPIGGRYIIILCIYYIVLYYIYIYILYYQNYIILNYIKLYCIILYNVILHYIVLLYYIMLYYCIILLYYIIILFYVILHLRMYIQHRHRNCSCSSIVCTQLTPPSPPLTAGVIWPFTPINNQEFNKLHLFRIVEGSLEVKLPTIWTVEKQRWEESEEKRSEERRCRCAKR